VPNRRDPMSLILWLAVLLMILAFFLTHEEAASDYLMYERAAHRVAQGQLATLYDPLSKQVPKYHYSYAFAFGFRYLAQPFAWGRWIYFCLLGGCLLFILRESCRLGRDSFSALTERQQTCGDLMTVIATAYFGYQSFREGNIALVITALTLAAMLNVRRFAALSGGLLGTAASIKPFPVLLLVIWFESRYWKAIGWAIAVAMVWYLGVPAAAEGLYPALRLLWNQGETLARYSEHWDLSSPLHQNISGFILRGSKFLGAPRFAASATAVFACIATFGVFFAAKGWRARWGRQYECALLLSLMTIAVPMSWPEMGVQYAPALSLVVRSAISKVRWSWAAYLFFLAFASFGNSTGGAALAVRWLGFYSMPFLAASVLIVALAGRKISK
jgi:hypothetical protein